jgi:hypothetical protein
MMPVKFGEQTFQHIAYEQASCYVLRNRQSPLSQPEIEEMFKATYPLLLDWHI